VIIVNRHNFCCKDFPSTVDTHLNHHTQKNMSAQEALKRIDNRHRQYTERLSRVHKLITPIHTFGSTTLPINLHRESCTLPLKKRPLEPMFAKFSPNKRSKLIANDDDTNNAYSLRSSHTTVNYCEDMEDSEQYSSSDSDDEDYVPSKYDNATTTATTTTITHTTSTTPQKSVIHIKWNNEWYLLKKDLAIAAGINNKFVPEVLAAKYEQIEKKKACITLDVSHCEQLKLQHPGVKSSMFRVLGLKSGHQDSSNSTPLPRQMRLYSIDFLNYLKKQNIAHS
jgi:hypothetical protein